MSSRTVVVDGSNIATEGRQMPSLMQLDEAVRAYREEHPDHEVIVVVDATFAHRIPEDERPLYEEAAAHNELVYPPAGAIGRGDAFLLRIAEKTGAVVLSNDSFQEFHGEHDWLFEKGRLVGGTPVPGVGWIFVDRTPVRGPKSREAVKEAKRTKARIGSKEASQPMPVPKAPPPARKKAAKKAAMSSPEEETSVPSAIAVATEEAVSPDEASAGRKRKRRKRRGGGRGAGSADGAPASDLPTLNEPLTFIEFIAENKLGATVDGVVESFASHGAFVLVGDARCYIPLSAMGDPAPRAAREVLSKGEKRPFVVQALDAARRGIELALPGHEHLAGAPTEETVEAEIAEAPAPVHRVEAVPTAEVKPTRKPATKAPTKKTAAKKAGTKKTAAKKATAHKATPEKAAAKATAAKEPATTAKAVAAAEEAPKKTVTKKASGKKATAKKATAKKDATKRAAAKKVAAKAVPAKAATATKAPAKTGGAKSTSVKTASKKVAPKKAAAKKATSTTAAKKASAKKTSAKKGTKAG